MTEFLIDNNFATFGPDPKPDLNPRIPPHSFLDTTYEIPHVFPPFNPTQKIPYDFHSTTKEVLDGISLEGKTAVVTGGYSGIGLATTLALVGAGAHVFIPAKDTNKAKKALTDVTDSVTIVDTDLRDVDSIQAFADAYRKKRDTLDILINNAGVLQKTDRSHLDNGCGVHFWVNYVSHFVLTNILIDLIAKAKSPRVVNVSSAGHLKERLRFSDINCRQMFYDPDTEYAHSKTAMALFTVELGSRLKRINKSARAFSAHPGLIKTELVSKDEWLRRNFLNADDTPTKHVQEYYKDSLENAAATQVFCATSPRLDDPRFNGRYFEDCNLAKVLTGPTDKFRGVAPHALASYDAAMLWGVTRRMLMALYVSPIVLDSFG